MDITIYDENKPILLFEVKRDWNISFENNLNEIHQAYRYSLENGIRFIVLTNGDYYALFDRLKGLSIESNLIGFFKLSKLQNEDLGLIERLKINSLFNSSIREIFLNLSEMFD